MCSVASSAVSTNRYKFRSSALILCSCSSMFFSTQSNKTLPVINADKYDRGNVLLCRFVSASWPRRIHPSCRKPPGNTIKPCEYFMNITLRTKKVIELQYFIPVDIFIMELFEG